MIDARPAARRATLDWLILASLALLPLVCWPALERPFSSPKLWLIGAADLLVVARVLAVRGRPGWTRSWAWLLWLAAVSLAAVTAPVVVPAAFILAVLPVPLGLAAHRGDDGVMTALGVASGLESALVLFQYLGHDPFGWFGWQPEMFASSRMRVYGTLGNPDFVAAWLCATLPLVSRMPARLRLALAVLQMAAIAATGSRIAIVALPVAGVVMMARAGWPWKRWVVAALGGVLLALVLVWASPARPLGTTIRGRLYLARVVAGNLGGVPVTGYGPGAFEPQFRAWQDAWLRSHASDAPFAGAVDHAHDDYLEVWVEYGPLGFCVLVVLGGWAIVALWRQGDPAATGALAALLATACVDFPFHRPAEWALFAVLGSLTRRIH